MLKYVYRLSLLFSPGISSIFQPNFNKFLKKWKIKILILILYKSLLSVIPFIWDHNWSISLISLRDLFNLVVYTPPMQNQTQTHICGWIDRTIIELLLHFTGWQKVWPKLNGYSLTGNFKTRTIFKNMINIEFQLYCLHTYLILSLILPTTSSILASDCSVGNKVLIYSTALKSGRSKGSVLGITYNVIDIKLYYPWLGIDYLREI